MSAASPPPLDHTFTLDTCDGPKPAHSTTTKTTTNTSSTSARNATPTSTLTNDLAPLPPPPPSRTRPHVLRSTTASRQGSPASKRNFKQSSAGGSVVLSLGHKNHGMESTCLSGEEARELGKEENLQNGSSEGGEKGLERRKREAWGSGTGYLHEHDSIRNDYSQHYVSTGRRPQNFIRGAKVEERFSEYPKLSRLLDLKHSVLSSPSNSISPTFLNLSPSTTLQTTLSTRLDPTSFKFDVILLTPTPSTTFEELKALELGKWSFSPGFVWLWVGDGRSAGGGGVGLERGRELLGLWGYRRCEDIVWLKTNTAKPDSREANSPSLFTPSIEHCLMGIRGTVRRSTDPWFVHCNVDTDVIVWEGDTLDPLLKPPELQSLIENFCQGTRRLHLYGSPRSLRRGWVTVKIPTITSTLISNDDEASAFSQRSFVRPIERESQESHKWTPTPFDPSIYASRLVANSSPSSNLIESFSKLDLNPTNPTPLPLYLPYHPELDALRPKSPPPRAGQASSGGLGRGRGAGLGVTRSLVMKGVGMRSVRGQQRGQGGIGGGARGAIFQAPSLAASIRGNQHVVMHPDAILDPIEYATTTDDGRMLWIPARFAPGHSQGQGASFEPPLHQPQHSFHFSTAQHQQQYVRGGPHIVDPSGSSSRGVVRPPPSGFAGPHPHLAPPPSLIPYPIQPGLGRPYHNTLPHYHPQQQHHPHQHQRHHLGLGSSYPSFDPQQQQQHLVRATWPSTWQLPSHSQYHLASQYQHQQQQPQPQQQEYPGHHPDPSARPSLPFSLTPPPAAAVTAGARTGAGGDWVYPIGGPGGGAGGGAMRNEP